MQQPVTLLNLVVLTFFIKSIRASYNYTEYWHKRNLQRKKTAFFEEFAIQVTKGWHKKLHLENTKASCFPDVTEDNLAMNDEVVRDIETVGNLYWIERNKDVFLGYKRSKFC